MSERARTRKRLLRLGREHVESIARDIGISDIAVASTRTAADGGMDVSYRVMGAVSVHVAPDGSVEHVFVPIPAVELRRS